MARENHHNLAMPHPTRIDFLDALRILTTKGKTVAPKSFSPEEAPGGYLAEAVEIVQTFPSKTGARRAARNGYALPLGIKEGEEATVAGTVPPDGHPRGEPSSLSGKAQGWRVWRVDTGAFLPEGADRVLRVSDGVIVGTDRIRVLKLPPEGSGTVKPLTGPSRRRALFEAGTRLDARLRSLAAASGISSLSVRPPFSVGFGTVGDELIDLASPVGPGPGEEHRRDVTGPWLEESIARLALVPVSLGILPDSVDPIRDAILRA